jgi:ornithine cyclodeaminase
MLDPGAHVTAIGAITPERAELAADVVAGAGTIVVDDVATARRLARELTDALGAGDAGWSRVRSLADAVGGGSTPRDGGGWSLFKAMGVGLADLALGATVLRAARDAGLGRPIPQPGRSRPRLRAT